jgi:hypothetical protein
MHLEQVLVCGDFLDGLGGELMVEVALHDGFRKAHFRLASFDFPELRSFTTSDFASRKHSQIALLPSFVFLALTVARR